MLGVYMPVAWRANMYRTFHQIPTFAEAFFALFSRIYSDENIYRVPGISIISILKSDVPSIHYARICRFFVGNGMCFKATADLAGIWCRVRSLA